MSTWNDASTRPDKPGLYFRSTGRSVESAYWDGKNWFLAKKIGGDVVRYYETPCRNQDRPWRPPQPRGASALPDVGQRFHMLQFVRDVGYDEQRHCWLCIFRCDCGSEKAMNLYEVRSGANRSCGCLRDAPEVRDKQKKGRQKWRMENRESIMSINKRLGKNRMGTEQPLGANGKWAFNIHAKFWRIKAPSGLVIEGWNLTQLIRDNQELFSADDLVWKRGMCRASKGIRQLAERRADGRPKARSWKGWEMLVAAASGELER